MRRKRLLTMLLAIVMVLSVLSPAAMAVSPVENSVMNPGEEEVVDTTTKSESSRFDNDLVVSEDSANGLKTLRDEDKLTVDVQEAEAVEGEGSWSATKVDVDLDLTLNEVPACIEELQEAAEVFEQDEKVVAFVVMEQAPLSESVSSISRVAPADEAQLLSEQNEVIDEIETKVLKGEELNVRYQFTYLTNSFSVETEFGNLERIAMMDGVKSVFVMPVYEPCTVDGTADPLTSSAGEMTGVAQVWQELEYTGAGMKIAVIDTGLDLDHPSFAADPQLTESSMTEADIDAVLQDLNAYAKRSTITAETLYRSAKVPFAFNYVDASLTADHSSDSQGDHGTHVSGIAAANATEGTSVVGMAPDAQIIVMKVFGANGGAYMDDIVAALEDAMTLGCDVVNASLGSPAGFSSSDSELDLIYERLDSQDIVACYSAGNEGTSSYGNMWGTDLNRTQNPDNATIGSPALYANVLSIASAENAKVMNAYFTIADGTQVFYMDPYLYYYAMTDLIDPEYWGYTDPIEYVIIDGLGEEADFYDEEGNSLVEGKIAVIKRGEISFATKIFNAEYAGAVAAIIWDNVSENIFNFGMQISEDGETYPSIPACLVSLEDGQVLADAETKTLLVSSDLGERENASGGQMSSFSSWGVSPDLRLVPDITGIGGNVYSCYDGGEYGLMSGTSMSSPQVAGVTALVMQRLYELYPDSPDGTVRELALALMMSTADPIIDSASGVEASPRQQGAGLVDAYEAVTSEAYLTVGGDRPKAELGDSTTGTYKFSFEIHNISDEDKTYTLDASLLSEAITGYYVDAEYTQVEYFMAGYDWELSGNVSFDKNVVTVPAGGRSNVTVTVKLSDDDKALFDAYWENGCYVEGYVYLANEEGEVELNLPFLGFYGDWTEAPVFDTAYWYGNSFWGAGDGSVEGDEYFHVMWTDLAGTDWVLGFNPYSGALVDQNNNIIYDPAHNVISPNGDGVIDGLSEIYVSLLRNAKTLTFTYTVDGEIMHRETITNNSKTMYYSSYGQVVPWLYSWYGTDKYDFTDADGNAFPTGTEVLLTIDATVDYETGGDHSIEIPMIVDVTAPELVDFAEMPQEDGTQILGVQVADETALASVVLMNPAGTQIYAQVYDSFTGSGSVVGMDILDDGSYVVYFDVTSLGNEFLLAVCDYGANESYYNVKYTSNGDNAPDMSAYADQVFAYRVYDDHIYSDHMYGWVSLNKPASAEEYADISVWSDDYLEYAAINAAEYVGGKIFAVDAVYNLVVMEPGLWNRTTICNLGINVLDMTFDDSTDTMYVLTKESNYYVTLWSLDLMTGEMTELKYYGAYSRAPLAIADDDNGTIYAVKYNSANLFTLDVENDYAMETVSYVDADGAEVTLMIKDSAGSNVAPGYAQSMTYSEGKLYWGYYHRYEYASELIVIDVDALTSTAHTYHGQAYDSTGTLVDYYPMTELVGLLTLTETDYQLPEAEALESLLLSDESLVMTVGSTATVTASPLPWNYEIQEISWTSSDPAVATVADGRITGVSEGKATITVTADGVSAEVDVTVVKVDGNFYAYNYYSGDGYYGYMIDVDMGTMDYSLTDEAPADFLAGDYNGHNGNFYGYTEGGQFWRYNVESGEVDKLGNPIGTVPVDMAYDYSTGFMYAMTVDYNMGVSTLSVVNLNTGALQTVYAFEGYYFITLACDDLGNLYTVSAYGELCKISMTGGQPSNMEFIMDGLGDVYYMQSMCWDHENEVLLWAYCEMNSIYWIDVNAETPYVLSLGDPTESGLFEFVGMHTIPSEIPELAEVAVDDVIAEDMMILVGSTKYPSVTVYPFNATNQTVTLVSGDASIVKANADGTLTGVAEGEATVSYELVDGENVYEGTFNVTVIQAADDIYGQVMTDLATYGGQYWIRIYAQDPSDPDILTSTAYTIYAEEQVDGKLYAVGYDPNDWSGNWQMFILNPETQSVYEQIELGEGYPFIYDMTYDYATSTMYCVAGPSDNDSDLYALNMETGELVLVMQTEQFFMSLAAGADGKIYAMENSKEVITDDWDPWATAEYTNAMLYTIDPVEGTVELVGDTGMKCNMIASMAYDYDTNRLYWTPMYSGSSYISGLAIVDPATGAATNLGAIGMAGAQVGGLYILSDNMPEDAEPALHKLIVNPAKTSVTAGSTVAVNAYTLPLSLEAEVTWCSSNENVATVDENGIVTGVAQGKAEITATVTYNGVTMTGSCSVAVLDADAFFLSYNMSVGGWAAISRADASVVTQLTQDEEENVVSAVAAKGSKVYGYDVTNIFFALDTETYERTTIGSVDTDAIITDYLMNWYGYGEDEVAEYVADYGFDIRDMEYDTANERMLVLGNVYDVNYGEEVYGNGLYEVNLETGDLTLLHTFTDVYYVMGMAVDNNGIVYYYSAYNDYYYALDLTSGTATGIVTMQTQSYYGDYESDHALYFDELTGLVYHLFTSNGNFYRLFSMDPASGALTLVSEYVGEVVYDDASWAYIGNYFQGLTFFEEHVCEYTAVVTDPTCTEQGYTTYTCECGDSYVSDYVDATGHNVVMQESSPATCEENGYEYYACENCGGEEYTIILEATGHSFKKGECTVCGAEDPDYNPIKDWFSGWFGSWWGNDDEEEETEPSVPETTEPEETEPSVPETTEPEETEPSVPETTEPEETEPSVPETTEPDDGEEDNSGSWWGKFFSWIWPFG